MISTKKHKREKNEKDEFSELLSDIFNTSVQKKKNIQATLPVIEA